MNREPDGWRREISPSNAVTYMGADMNIAAGLEEKRLGLAFENQAGRSGKEDYPLGPILVVPLVRCSRMTGRDDSFDPDIPS